MNSFRRFQVIVATFIVIGFVALSFFWKVKEIYLTCFQASLVLIFTYFRFKLVMWISKASRSELQSSINQGAGYGVLLPASVGFVNLYSRLPWLNWSLYVALLLVLVYFSISIHVHIGRRRREAEVQV